MDRSTCWTLIRDAARGSATSRDDFATRYQPVVRAYLAARWGGGPMSGEVDEALQEVFVECLKHGGALEKAPALQGEFRAFLLGVTRNVARRLEERAAHRLDAPGSETFHPDELDRGEERQSVAFDRAWARVVVAEARERMAHLAAGGEADARRRVELLRLRFQEGRSIADIARSWGVGADELQRAYTKACREFEAALREVVLDHHPGNLEGVGRRCRELRALLH